MRRYLCLVASVISQRRQPGVEHRMGFRPKTVDLSIRVTYKGSLYTTLSPRLVIIGRSHPPLKRFTGSSRSRVFTIQQGAPIWMRAPTAIVLSKNRELRTRKGQPSSSLDLELLQNRDTKGKSRHRNLKRRFRLRDMLGIRLWFLGNFRLPKTRIAL
jgi:hypothetical protein